MRKKIFLCKKKALLLTAVCAVCLLSALIAFLTEQYVKPPLLAAASQKIHNLMLEAVYQSIKESNEALAYSGRLVQAERDSEGRVVFVRSDALYLNQIAAQITQYINREISRSDHMVLHLPLGLATGSHILAAHGPDIEWHLLLSAAQTVEIRQESTSLGINQTKHTLYLYAKISSTLVAPFCKEEILTEVKAPLAEYLLIGGVPGTYVNFNAKPQ